MESFRLVDRVIERDLDLALLSALFVSEDFRSFLLRNVLGWGKGHGLVRACVSEWMAGRETDVLLVVDLEGSERIAILIEDKIDARFQPDQGNGYRKRGQQGIRDGRWNSFATCLCAPENYLVGVKSNGEWDATVSLESITEWAKQSNDRCHAFIGTICAEVVAKHAARRLPISLEATEFWSAYRQLAKDLLPEVDISRLPDQVSEAFPWPQFGAALLPTHMLLEHKPQQGRADLTFNKFSIEALKQLTSEISLPLEVTLEKAGASAALRIAVPPVDHFRPCDEQREELLSAFAAVDRLLAVGMKLATMSKL